MEADRGVLYLFPASMRERWQQVAREAGNIQEIRLRRDRPVIVQSRDGEFFLTPEGELRRKQAGAWMVSQAQMEELLQYMCRYSIYAYEDELRRGFLTMPGGHRVGVAGQAVPDTIEGIKNLKHISYMNIRVSHQILGAADNVLPYLYEGGNFLSTLIISPPGCGKTTLLRDLVRQVSDGSRYGAGVTVGVVDERSELAGSFLGQAQNDMGMRTDVLDSCPKVCGMMMLIRSMSPRVIAVDELGGKQDSEALHRAAACGCRLLATMHGEGLWKGQECYGGEDLAGLFQRFILLEKRNGMPHVRQICGEEGKLCFDG